MTITRTNRYAGKCECGTDVAANAGLYHFGQVFCSQPVLWTSRLVCPKFLPTLEKAEAERQAMEAARWAHIVIQEVTSGVCGKCDGSGKYRYWNGDLGVCFPCEGSGRLRKD